MNLRGVLGRRIMATEEVKIEDRWFVVLHLEGGHRVKFLLASCEVVRDAEPRPTPYKKEACVGCGRMIRASPVGNTICGRCHFG